jgi:hypothetical protein
MESLPRRAIDRWPATSLDAAVISTAVLPLLGAPDPAAAVLSVHRGAVNLQVRGAIVGIVEAGSGALPNAILVEPHEETWTAGLRAGLRVELRPGGLVIGDDRLGVRLAGARAWSPRLAGVEIVAAGLPDRLMAARDALRVSGGGGTEGEGGLAVGLFAGTPGGALSVLRAALMEGQLRAATVAGAALVGLGSGLTPAGDDLLVGLTAALTATGHPAARVLAQDWAAHAATATTPLAAAFHRHAAEAQYAQRIHEVLAAVLAGTVSDAVAAVERAAAWGATSGRDVLAGVLLGLDVSTAGSARAAAGLAAAVSPVRRGHLPS